MENGLEEGKHGARAHVRNDGLDQESRPGGGKKVSRYGYIWRGRLTGSANTVYTGSPKRGI